MNVTDVELGDPNLPKRLRRARRDLGLTQEAVADAVGLARTSLVALEKGERGVRPDELVAMAGLYGRPIDELLRPTPPVEGFVAQFRTSLSRSKDAEQLEVALRDVERLAEDYRELERLSGIGPETYPPPYDIARLSPDAAALEIAASERTRLGLGDGPVANLREVLETKVWMRIFAVPLPARVEGFFAFTPETGACVAVNANHPAERQQWTLAHEFSHFLTRRLLAEVKVAQGYSRVPAHERFAEAFAREFLMPTAGLTRDFNALMRTGPEQVTAGALVELAGFYRVSFQALVLRLEGLGLLPGGTYDMLAHERFSVSEARRLLGVPAPEPDTRTLPLRYVRLGVEAYRDGRISEGAFARFLRLDRVTARELARLTAADAGGAVEEGAE
jgi:Zn-dependent peptidase ImmA (M78 family)/DNA-binding XRE family transcriptional regulator